MACAPLQVERRRMETILTPASFSASAHHPPKVTIARMPTSRLPNGTVVAVQRIVERPQSQTGRRRLGTPGELTLMVTLTVTVAETTTQPNPIIRSPRH